MHNILMLIPTDTNVKTITDMREDAIGLLHSVKKLGLVYVFQRSNPQAVLLSLEEFARLQELVEDHLDEMEAEKLTKQPRGKGVPLSQILKAHKQYRV